MVEKLIPEFAQLHESVTSKILKKLATLFITKEIREIYRAFSTEFDVLTAQACCDLDQCRGGSPLRIDVPAELDPSKFTWSDFDMKGRPKMSFEIQKAKW
jgi:hypothetical protein